MLSLCRDCCELDISHVDHNADVTVDYALDVSSAWRWYTLIPPQLSYSDEYSDHNISPLSLQLSAIQQCYVEYKDICFAFTALIYQDRPDGDSTVGTDDFMEKASQQLQSLQAFCLKWIINQPSANTSSTLNLFEQHINSYNAASAAEIHRLKMRATADITNLDAGDIPFTILYLLAIFIVVPCQVLNRLQSTWLKKHHMILMRTNKCLGRRTSSC